MAERLSRPLLYTYGIADLFFVMLTSMELYFFAAFLTDYAAFSLGIVGNILVITSLGDIVCALAGGIILQKVTLRFGGKYRSWFLVGPLMFLPLSVLQFTKIGSDLIAGAIIIFGFVTSHLLWNVVSAANGSMVGRLSTRPDERTILSSSRAQGMAAAGLLFSFSGMALITYFGERTDRIMGFSLATAVYGLATVLGYLYIYRLTAGRDPYNESNAAPGSRGPSLREIVGLVFKNPPLLGLIFAQTFNLTSLFMVTSLAIYYFTYVQNNPGFVSPFILITSLGRFAGTLAASWIGVRIGKRRCYWMFLACAAVLFFFARFACGTSWGFTILCALALMVYSIAVSMITALFSDTVIYGEWKTGSNIRAFTMALMNIPIKVGVFLRSVILSVGLGAIGFVANAAPTPDVISGISSLITLIPAAACGIAAVIFYFGYRLDDRQVLHMQEEIASR
ncbi:MAG: MFS transporter [Acidobacteriota bacterium]|nr:MFS transporter [Acidobacteriota bacterium]